MENTLPQLHRCERCGLDKPETEFRKFAIRKNQQKYCTKCRSAIRYIIKKKQGYYENYYNEPDRKADFIRKRKLAWQRHKEKKALDPEFRKRCTEMARIRRKKYRKQRVFKRMSSNIKRFDKVKIPAIELWKIAKKQKCKCALTGRRLTNENISIDHITPQALGGKTSLENIRFVIREANNAKWILTDKDLLELAKDIVKTLS